MFACHLTYESTSNFQGKHRKKKNQTNRTSSNDCFCLLNYFHIFSSPLPFSSSSSSSNNHQLVLVLKQILSGKKRQKKKKTERLVKRSTSFLYIYIIISAHNLIWEVLLSLSLTLYISIYLYIYISVYYIYICMCISNRKRGLVPSFFLYRIFFSTTSSRVASSLRTISFVTSCT